MSNKTIDIQKDAVILSNEKSNLSKIIKCEINNEIYFYKENEIFNENIYPLNIAEVLAGYLFKEVGIKNFTKYQFAQNGENSFGVISKNFIPKNNIIVKSTLDLLTQYIFQKKHNKSFDILKDFDFNSKENIKNAMQKKLIGTNLNSVEMVLEIVEEICLKNKIKLNKEIFKENLLQTITLDYFLSNPDRNMNNLLLFVNKNEDELEMEVCPIFDNGYGLGVRDFYVQKYLNLERNIKDFTYLAVGVTKESQITPYTKYNNDKFISDLVNAIKPYPNLINLAKNCLDLNMEKLISSFEKNEEIKLEPELSNFIVETYNKRVKNFNKILHQTNEKETSFTKQ